MSPIPCAVLGATGAVGQRFVHLLRDHPTFAVRAVTASPGSQGKTYGDAVAWFMDGPVPAAVSDLVLVANEDVPADVRVVFSALPGGLAGPVESALVAAGHAVFTNARDHRMDPDVPLLIPEVNPHALDAVRDREGFLVANGNCSGILLTLALAPVHRAFGIAELDVTTMQARSGAGNPATVELDTRDNLLPHIGGEEDKLETEPLKVLEADFPIRATCTRVDVSDGHFATVHARLRHPTDRDALVAAFEDFRAPPAVAGLPSAPQRPVHVHHDDARPQPRLDRDLEGGMAVSVGRIRVHGDRVRFVVLGHNTVRGAAGQSILNAEYAASQGLL